MTQQYRLASMAPWLPTHDSAVSPCFHGSLAFLHRHFPPQSPPSHPLDPSLQSTAVLIPGLLHNPPKLQLPATAPSRGPVSLSGVCMAVARTLCISFHLGHHRSAVSLSILTVSPLTQDNRPDVGMGPLLSFPYPQGTSPVLLTLLFFPRVPSSYRVLPDSIYYFPLVRHSCPLSAGVLHALLYLKVYS